MFLLFLVSLLCPVLAAEQHTPRTAPGRLWVLKVELLSQLYLLWVGGVTSNIRLIFIHAHLCADVMGVCMHSQVLLFSPLTFHLKICTYRPSTCPQTLDSYRMCSSLFL